MSKTYQHHNLSPAAALTADAYSPVFPVTGSKVGIAVAVSATDGTSEAMDVSVEWGDFDGTNFVAADGTADTLTQIAADGPGTAKSFDAKGPWARLFYDLGGTSPSFTFTAAAIVS